MAALTSPHYTTHLRAAVRQTQRVHSSHWSPPHTRRASSQRCCTAAAVTRRLTIAGMATDAAAAAAGAGQGDTTAAAAAPPKPCLAAEAVVQKQLEAYNARDIEAFLAVMADDCVATDAVSGAVLCSGKEQLRARYSERFQTPVHSELLGRLCLGNVVVDREIITGLPGAAAADCLATYHCQGGLIRRMEFVWSSRRV